MGNNGAVSLLIAARRVAVCLLAPIALVSLHASPAMAASVSPVDTNDRSAVVALFNSAYATTAPAAGWTGTRAPCDSGTLSAAYRDAAFTRLNLFRALAGVPSSISEDATYTQRAQDAALIRAMNEPPANNNSPHDPHPSSACYTTAGHAGSSGGNLYWESGAPLNALEVMDGWLDDAGVPSVGHRVWMLHPPMTKAGYGDVPQSSLGDGGQVLYVQDQFSSAWPSVTGPAGGVAWPPRGFVPYQMTYRDWSITIKGADLRNATITMTRNGTPISVTKVSGTLSGGVPESTLVWRPATCTVVGVAASCGTNMPITSYSIFPDTMRHARPSADTAYDVIIQGAVIGGTSQTISYRTTVIDPATSGTAGTGSTGGGTSVGTPAVGFEAITPERVLDTRRSGQTRLQANVERELVVAGQLSIPAAASAVAINVTALEPDADGFMSVYPCGSRPDISTLNFVRGQVVPNAAVVGLSAGKLCLFSSAATGVIVDVGGYQLAGGANRYSSLAVPGRVVDTRLSSRVTAGGVLEVVVTGGEVPSSAAAVTMNVTATHTLADGFVTAYPCGTTRPTASNLNPTAGTTRPNLVTVKVGANGKVCLYTSSTTDLIVDLAGFWGPTGASPFVALAQPQRPFDTRRTNAKVGANSITTVSLGVPSNASAVQLNVTAVNPSASGFFTVYPADSATVPTASNVNFAGGDVVPNAVTVRPVNGQVKIFSSAGSDLIVDVLGYYA